MDCKMVPSVRSPLGPDGVFQQWRRDAATAGLIMPDSAVIATSTRTGVSSARTVCFRRMDRGQFVFLTDSRSKKCREMAENPAGCVAFLWAFVDSDGCKVTRQVRVEGRVLPLPREEFEDLYWALIPNRRVRAYICEQGREADWDQLQRRHDELQEEVLQGRELPMPDHFVAYELEPNSVEFYEDTENDIPARLLYSRREDGSWQTA